MKFLRYLIFLIPLPLMSQTVVASYVNSGSGWAAWNANAGFGSLSYVPGTTVYMYCQASAGAAWQPCNPSGGGGSGTVTSIATTSPLGGGTITSTGTLTCTTCVVASSPGAGIAHFAGSTQTVTSSAVALTTDVSGVLPLANGGTNNANGAATALLSATTNVNTAAATAPSSG